MRRSATARISLFLISALVCCAEGAAAAPVSFSRQVRPILLESCAGCHRPGKLKGKLDLTSYRGFRAGGKSGLAFQAGDAEHSLVVKQVDGPKPEMPDKGDPLSPRQVAILRQWIQEGAADDSAAETDLGPKLPEHATVYKIAPVITALAFSPDGQSLAVAGEHEVLIHNAQGAGLLKRLPSRSPRMTGLLFSRDGQQLIATGGAPGQFGEVELWKTADWTPVNHFTLAADTLFGPALSPEGDRLAFGGADRSVRVILLKDGSELLRIEPFTDWALDVVFTPDGKQVAGVSRDKSVKVVDLARPGEFMQVIEPADPLLCAARHPTEDLLACGGAGGSIRIYHIVDVKKPTEANQDPNRIREIDRQPGPVNTLAFSRDGALLAAGSVGDVRVYKSSGEHVATLTGPVGPVYAVAFSPDGKTVATAGFEGVVRLFQLPDGKPLRAFAPAPIGPVPATMPATGELSWGYSLIVGSCPVRLFNRRLDKP